MNDKQKIAEVESKLDGTAEMRKAFQDFIQYTQTRTRYGRLRLHFFSLCCKLIGHKSGVPVGAYEWCDRCDVWYVQ